MLAFAGIAYYGTTSFPAVPDMLSQNVPPTFFPRLVLGALAVCGVALLLQRNDGAGPRPEPIGRVVLVTSLLFTTSIWLMPRVGMLATTSLIAIVIPRYWGERRKLVLAGLAAGLPLMLYLIFVVSLDMRLPRGIGW